VLCLQRLRPPTTGFTTTLTAINEREMPKTCLTNHKGSISHHITSLFINSLGADTQTNTHTHTQAYRHHGQKQFQETSCVAQLV